FLAPGRLVSLRKIANGSRNTTGGVATAASRTLGGLRARRGPRRGRSAGGRRRSIQLRRHYTVVFMTLLQLRALQSVGTRPFTAHARARRAIGASRRPPVR